MIMAVFYRGVYKQCWGFAQICIRSDRSWFILEYTRKNRVLLAQKPDLLEIKYDKGVSEFAMTPCKKDKRVWLLFCKEQDP